MSEDYERRSSFVWCVPLSCVFLWGFPDVSSKFNFVVFDSKNAVAPHFMQKVC